MVAVQNTLRPMFPSEKKLSKMSTEKTVGQSRMDSPFNLIRGYSSKRHCLFLDYHRKLSHCHVDVTATTVGADLGTCHSR